MSLKLTELKIAPRHSYMDLSGKNPLVGSVKVKSDKAIIEVTLNEDTMQKMLDLCATEIADAAKSRIDDFVAEVRAINSVPVAGAIEDNSEESSE